LSERDLLLPIEQSCDADGLLLCWDMRAVRLQTLPLATLAKLHFFLDRCPRHTRALLVHDVFWLVRFERIHRQGTPMWTMTDTVTESDEEPAFFRPKADLEVSDGVHNPPDSLSDRWLHGGYMNPENNKAQPCGLG